MFPAYAFTLCTHSEGPIPDSMQMSSTNPKSTTFLPWRERLDREFSPGLAVQAKPGFVSRSKVSDCARSLCSLLHRRYPCPHQPVLQLTARIPLISGWRLNRKTFSVV
jgi:hypothetical protein